MIVTQTFDDAKYKVVPIVATEEMKIAAINCWPPKTSIPMYTAIYNAMTEASPVVPSQAVDVSDLKRDEIDNPYDFGLKIKNAEIKGFNMAIDHLATRGLISSPKVEAESEELNRISEIIHSVSEYLYDWQLKQFEKDVGLLRNDK